MHSTKLAKRRPSFHPSGHLTHELQMAPIKEPFCTMAILNVSSCRDDCHCFSVNISLLVDLSDHGEAANICTRTPPSAGSLEEDPSAGQSRLGMHQVQCPLTVFAASSSAPSPPACLQVLKQLTQVVMQRNHDQQ